MAATPAQPHLDNLYGCTANCLLYEADPGPSELNIGSQLEPRMVSRAQAWRDFYAQHLTLVVGANSQLLQHCLDFARQEYDRPRHNLAPDTVREALEFWACAIEIAQMAIDLVTGSGAADNDNDRQRLLASVEHQQTSTAFRVLPDIVERSATDLAEKLDQIDRNEPTS
ncbi:hypothetical protein [Nocardia pseudovaccinii]|uniref:hypothetical protein n=1 Tax=Nocardia pseudovaccinii TaxID=189540 RepID=UPI0007A3A165|nr:hypothetical protein [Nocardia pseudovaccinii]